MGVGFARDGGEAIDRDGAGRGDVGCLEQRVFNVVLLLLKKSVDLQRMSSGTNYA